MSSIRGVRRMRFNGLKLNFGSTSLRKNKSGPTTPSCKPVDGHKANFHETPIQKAVGTDWDHNSAPGTGSTLRPAVIARKVSCGNKTLKGARTWHPWRQPAPNAPPASSMPWRAPPRSKRAKAHNG